MENCALILCTVDSQNNGPLNNGPIQDNGLFQGYFYLFIYYVINYCLFNGLPHNNGPLLGDREVCIFECRLCYVSILLGSYNLARSLIFGVGGK